MAKKRKSKIYRRERKPLPKPTIEYTSKWGSIISFSRWRDTRPGKKGRFVSPRNVHKLKKYEPAEYKYQYRVSASGKRIGSPIFVEGPKYVVKKTFPGSIESYGGKISEAIEDTNITMRLHLYKKVFFNISGKTADGKIVRFQGTKIIGQVNQDQQLVIAIQSLLEKHGFRTQYNIELVRYGRKGRKGKSSMAHSRRLEPLDNMKFTMTLY